MVMLKQGLCGSMNAKIIGNGEDLVILAHGYGGDQSFWDKIAPYLAQKYQVLLFDWNFYGNFDAMKYDSLDAFADDLVGLLDEIDFNNKSSCVFVGHSMSAMIGCIASIKKPHLFNKLILIGASPRYLNSEAYEGGFEASEIEELLSTMEANYLHWASAFAPLAMGGKDPLSVEKLEKSLKRMKPEVALSIAKVIFLGDYRHVLDEVDTPCTLITTTNDIVVPSSVPYYMQKMMIKAKSTVQIIDVDGHFPHLTAHDQLLDVLGRVLDD